MPKECKMLLRSMLTYDPNKRISARDALRSPWIMKHNQSPDFTDVDLRLSLINLKKFRTQMFFQRAVLMYLASQKMEQKDEEKIRNTFEMIDRDKDEEFQKQN